MLAELEILQEKIKKAIVKEELQFEWARIIKSHEKDYEHTYEWDSLKDYYKKYLKTSHYYLVTCTFDSKVSVNLDIYGQTNHLKQVLNGLAHYHYFACFEKHKSGILHSHILIQGDDHKIQPLLMKNKKYLTKSINLAPAIQIKRVNNTGVDIDRVYDYIWDDKKDHPEYKRVFISF